jgi:hypothetical protein
MIRVVPYVRTYVLDYLLYGDDGEELVGIHVPRLFWSAMELLRSAPSLGDMEYL